MINAGRAPRRIVPETGVALEACHGTIELGSHMSSEDVVVPTFSINLPD